MNDTPSPPSVSGLAYGVTAYGLWGLVPLYFKAIVHVAPLEILAHRVLWSFVVLAALLTVAHRWRDLRDCLRSPVVMKGLLITSALIAVNWLTFIYAVCTEQVLQTSAGYFITPLVNVLLGMLVLGERLRPAQWAAVAFAVAGVLELTRASGELPWIALTLASSFGAYGLLRKTVAASGLVGLTVETLVLLPVAAGWVLYMGMNGGGAMGRAGSGTDLLLLASGLVTTAPLLCFVEAARRLRLTTLGFLQYLAPSISFVMAVTLFDEPFRPEQLASFLCIWAGLAIFSLDSVLAYRRTLTRLAVPAVAPTTAALHAEQV